MQLIQSVRLPYLFTACALILLITSCASPKREQTKTPTTSPTKTVQTPPSQSAASLLASAKTLAPAQAIKQLIGTNRAYLQEGSYQQALWLASKLQKVTDDSQQSYQLEVIAGQAALGLNQLSLAWQHLQAAQQLVEQQAELAHSLTFYQTLTQVQEQRGLAIAALAAKLNAFALNNNADETEISDIWQRFSALAPWQLTELKQQTIPYLNGWLQLTQYANRFGDNSAQLIRYLSQWRNQYPSHPAQALIPQLEAQLNDVDNTRFSKVENVAILLPLSGRQQLAGKAAQEGMLAAYNNNNSVTLHFIDTNQLDYTSLANKFDELKVDHVIGPLLKKNVERYLEQSELNLPVLLLNIPNQQLVDNQVAISMRPEDEAAQAATHLSAKAYQQPLVLVQNDAVSQRIADAFIQQWQLIRGKKPETLVIDSGSNMKASLEQSLGVKQSADRIKQLNQRIRQTLETETRNRRDIDMIYLVSSHQTTRLMKPYIDVNISPFADLIPVYASSRSHSVKADRDTFRDLTGLTFSEMPWRLASKQQNKALQSTSKALWPERSDSLQRIFAMGFDSLALIQKMTLMKQRTYIRHFGQTGSLMLNSDNILTRSLIWGRYYKTKVTEVALN